MTKEMIPEQGIDSDLIFKIGIGAVIVVIIYFIFNLFSKLREINNKLDSFLTDFKPTEVKDNSNEVIEDITEKKESNVDLTGFDTSDDLTTIEE
jgi:hypothetical protein